MRWLPLVVVLLPLPGAASTRLASAPRPDRPWGLVAEGGAGIPIPSNALTIRGTGSLAVSRVLVDHLELELNLRLGVCRISTDLAASGGAGFRFGLGPLRVTAGTRVGYVAMRVDKGSLGTLWTGALLLNPAVSLSYPLGRRFELRARLLTVSLYYNELWIVGWEPAVGLGVRF